MRNIAFRVVLAIVVVVALILGYGRYKWAEPPLNSVFGAPFQLTPDQLVGLCQRDDTSSLSPHGTKMLTVVRKGTTQANANAIWISDSDGSNLHPLTTPWEKSTDEGATWSPDGKKIAFVRWDWYGGDEIFMINPDGTELTKLSGRDSGDSYYEPTGELIWSPDGYHIAFIYEEYHSGDDAYHVAYLSTSSSFVERVDTTGWWDTESTYDLYSWTEDGRKHSYKSGADNIKVYDLDTGKIRDITSSCKEL